jgi:uncharacterized membrane protein
MPVAKDGEYYPVVVKQIIETGQTTELQAAQTYQKIKVQVLSGQRKDTEFILDYGKDANITSQQMLREGDTVVVSAMKDANGRETISIMDRYRLPGLVYLGFGFICIVIIFAGRQGFGAVVGLLVSAVVILLYIVPQVLAGSDVIISTIIGSIIILLFTMYLAHGIKLSTTISLAATVITLIVSGVLSYISVLALQLYGMGSEEANLLKFGAVSHLNLQGLFLAGMIMGIMGILDDVTTSQVAAVFELSDANKKFSVQELIRRGLSIGREHIASLVNTLVLAYAGASFPIFLFFVLNPQGQPAWVIFNSEYMSEEIVRTLSGSIGLVLGVPIATVMAAVSVKFLKHTKTM